MLIFYGMWCSLVAHLTGGQEVASSSLVIPIFKKWLKTLILKGLSHFSLFLQYLDSTKICDDFMSQKCRKIYNVAILSHRFTQKY